MKIKKTCNLIIRVIGEIFVETLNILVLYSLPFQTSFNHFLMVY